ncbi:MAG: OmpA family protein [Elusimicrobia bacterium]|nr:OmpA family protein [Candidatus Liberimonas magnetica]
MKKIILLSMLGVVGLTLFWGCATTKGPTVIILEKMIVLEDTHFKLGTDTLTKKGAQEMLRNLQILNENPEAKIRIAGYTSCSGTAEYNQKLSEKRANTVKAILKEAGIAPEKITTIGYGETTPSSYEPVCEMVNTKQARANMRVLFEVFVRNTKTIPASGKQP